MYAASKFVHFSILVRLRILHLPIAHALAARRKWSLNLYQRPLPLVLLNHSHAVQLAFSRAPIAAHSCCPPGTHLIIRRPAAVPPFRRWSKSLAWSSYQRRLFSLRKYGLLQSLRRRTRYTLRMHLQLLLLLLNYSGLEWRHWLYPETCFA